MGKKAKGMSPRMRRASGTNDAVERIIACTNRASRDLSAIPQASENVRRLRRGEPAQWPRSLVEAYGAEDVLSINDHASRNAVVDIWRQEGRVAYDIHPETAASMYRADLKGKLPGGLFNRLPHISPMMPLPHPWPFRSNDGTKGLIRAYFLTGRVGRESFCSTTDERSDGLGIMPWVEWEHFNGPDDYLGVATPLFVLPSTQDPFTMRDILDHTSAWHNSQAQGNEMKMVRQMLPGALTMLSYLCCKNADVDPPPTPARGKRHQAPPRDPFYVRVGWHIGPKLHAAGGRAGGRVRDGISVPSGVEYGPQHRVGHPKTVWVGPGRKRDESIWVDPYWTKLDMRDDMRDRGEEPGTQIVPVDPQHGDPASHKDIRRANLGTAKSREIAERERQQQRQDDWEF